MSLWNAHRGQEYVQPLTVDLVRVVESQDHIATLNLVDSLEEQAVLESLLESVKPGKLPARLHYLLASPFRYPPLAWGSRFGRRHEPSLFYASLNIETALSECAFYRLVFLEGMAEPFGRAVVSQHTSFRVRGHGERGVNLALRPFDQEAPVLRSPSDYRPTQQLGTDMREAGVMLCVYLSARDRRANALNAGIFVPEVLQGSEPRQFQNWTCHATPDGVRYLAAPGVKGRESYSFARETYLVNGRLPMPAE